MTMRVLNVMNLIAANRIAGKACVTLPLLTLLSACSSLAIVPGMDRVVGEEGMFRDRKGDYLKAETIPRTEVPAGMDSFIIDDLLVIPDLPAEAQQQAFLDPPRPNAIEGASEREVVIQRMDGRGWIIVDVSPSQVWPRIRDYFRQNNVVIAFENPTAGVMETGWFVLDGNVLTQEKFRVTVETGFQDNSAEIKLLQVEAPQSAPVIGQVPFQAQSMNSETEYTVLNSLSSYLADVADLYQASSVSFLAGNINSAGKAALSKTPAGSQILELRAEYNRAWAALGRALQRNGVQVVAQDIGQGTYELVYVPGQVPADEEEEAGFFRKVWTLGGVFGDDDLPSFNLQLQVLRAGESIEVLVKPTVPTDDAATQEAGNSLLELLRNTIA
ncbi:MAG: outer membrane protein assembly factor BamC [Pseudomonadota bacterium]